MDKKKDLLNQKLFEILNNEVLDLKIKNCDADVITVRVAELADRICDAISKGSTEKHGEWNVKQFALPLSDGSKTAFNCSECNTTWDYATDYCPNCGAKMDLR